VSSVALSENFESRVDFPEILAALGVRRFSIQGLADYNDYCVEHRLLGDSAAASTFDAIEAACLDHGIYFDLSAPDRSALELQSPAKAKQQFYDLPGLEPDVTRQCTLPWEMPYADKDGRVYPCCFAGSQNEGLLGNLSDESLAAVWEGPAYKQFRQDITNPESTPEVCRRCTLAPLGEYPLKRFSARVLNESIRSDGRTIGFTIENIGGETWNADQMIRVGTAHPRDHASPVAHPTWLFANRAAAINSVVMPGERCEVIFSVSPQSVAYEEHFQIVVEGLVWLPETRFTVTVPAGIAAKRSRVPRTEAATRWRQLAAHGIMDFRRETSNFLRQASQHRRNGDIRIRH
jgi:radical SAM protein with 4Fe4S-binding SPASM domain